LGAGGFPFEPALDDELDFEVLDSLVFERFRKATGPS